MCALPRGKARIEIPASLLWSEVDSGMEGLDEQVRISEYEENNCAASLFELRDRENNFRLGYSGTSERMGLRGVSMVTEAEEIYTLYPRKVGKTPAIKAIKKAMKKVQEKARLWDEDHNSSFLPGRGVEWLKERTKMFAESPAGQHDGLFDGYHPPHPATWFNQDRYNDSPEEWYAVDAKRSKDLRMASEANVGVWRPS